MKMSLGKPSSSEEYAIMGQSRVNQLGGRYINGKPLPQVVRAAIVEMHNNGVKPCMISRKLRISHGAVSKILNRFQETGSVAPGQIGGNQRQRKTVQSVEKHILNLKEAAPDRSAFEIQEALVSLGFCTKNNVPTVNSIARYMRSHGHNHEHKADKKLNHSIENILGLASAEAACNIADARCNSADSSPSTGSANNSRSRINFSQEQVDLLEKAYARNPYPSAEEKEQISKGTGLNQERVWFSNRRARLRKNFGLADATLTQPFKANPLLIQQLLQVSPSLPGAFPPFLLPPMFPMATPFWLNKTVFMPSSAV